MRRPRGEQRRAALVAAAAELLLERGFGAVSHRAVAGRAGMALAATTYYFTSLDDLLLAAVEHLAADWLADATAAVGRLPAWLDDDAALAGALVDVVVVGADEQVVTMYERYLEAGRHPHLRPAVTAYGASLDALLLDVLRRGRARSTPEDVRRLLALVDGTVVRALAEGVDPRPLARAALATSLAEADGT